jgi:molybdopterin converting factor small subunit
MAKVRIDAKLGIARYMPGERGDFEIEIGDAEKVSGLLARLGVPEGAVALVMINQEKGEPDTVLKDGDVVSLLPLIVGG